MLSVEPLGKHSMLLCLWRPRRVGGRCRFHLHVMKAKPIPFFQCTFQHLASSRHVCGLASSQEPGYLTCLTSAAVSEVVCMLHPDTWIPPWMLWRSTWLTDLRVILWLTWFLTCCPKLCRHTNDSDSMLLKKRWSVVFLKLIAQLVDSRRFFGTLFFQGSWEGKLWQSKGAMQRFRRKTGEQRRW